MAILGLRFGRYPIPTNFVDFDVASELLGICYPFTSVKRQYIGPTNKPQIHMKEGEHTLGGKAGLYCSQAVLLLHL